MNIVLEKKRMPVWIFSCVQLEVGPYFFWRFREDVDDSMGRPERIIDGEASIFAVTSG